MRLVNMMNYQNRESELLSGKFQTDDPSIEMIRHVMLL